MDTTLYWWAARPPTRDYTVFVQILADGKLVAQTDSPPRDGKYPTSLWQAGEVVADVRSLSLRGLRPGRYRLVVGMCTPQDVRRLQVTSSAGETVGDFVELPTVEIGP
ncbi:MAG: hypothetical protein M1401_09850 [Chloroflexi bacterium]|nr:hypothetical protein [Chloroflexota bacterium]MCL5109149.1 hypothetical protein [Chloroflexota bacterium]